MSLFCKPKAMVLYLVMVMYFNPISMYVKLILSILLTFRLGDVIIYIRLVFNTLGLVPSESQVLNVVKTILGSHFQRRDVENPAKLHNVTYESKSVSYCLN